MFQDIQLCTYRYIYEKGPRGQCTTGGRRGSILSSGACAHEAAAQACQKVRLWRMNHSSTQPAAADKVREFRPVPDGSCSSHVSAVPGLCPVSEKETGIDVERSTQDACCRFVQTLFHHQRCVGHLSMPMHEVAAKRFATTSPSTSNQRQCVSYGT
jgi:hypothetical protein